jgi:hypothetical protein
VTYYTWGDLSPHKPLGCGIVGLSHIPYYGKNIKIIKLKLSN